MAVEDSQGKLMSVNFYGLLSRTLQSQLSYHRRDVKYSSHKDDLFALGLDAVLTKWL